MPFDFITFFIYGVLLYLAELMYIEVLKSKIETWELLHQRIVEAKPNATTFLTFLENRIREAKQLYQRFRLIQLIMVYHTHRKLAIESSS